MKIAKLRRVLEDVPRGGEEVSDGICSLMWTERCIAGSYVNIRVTKGDVHTFSERSLPLSASSHTAHRWLVVRALQA